MNGNSRHPVESHVTESGRQFALIGQQLRAYWPMILLVCILAFLAGLLIGAPISLQFFPIG